MPELEPITTVRTNPYILIESRRALAFFEENPPTDKLAESRFALAFYELNIDNSTRRLPVKPLPEVSNG